MCEERERERQFILISAGFDKPERNWDAEAAFVSLAAYWLEIKEFHAEIFNWKECGVERISEYNFETFYWKAMYIIHVYT